MLNHLKPTLKLLRNRIFRCAAACPLGAHCRSVKISLHARSRDFSEAAKYFMLPGGGNSSRSCNAQQI
ncbi:MAG: hypothetical protein ABJI96_04715 [Paracoccaceae bacterium]|uniref:hypothetical protein n=1 Tax=Roseibium sp. TaxID=1936156 RepID=UPI0013DF19D7